MGFNSVFKGLNNTLHHHTKNQQAKILHFFNVASNYKQFSTFRKLSRKITVQLNADRKIYKSKSEEHKSILCTLSHATDISFPEN